MADTRISNLTVITSPLSSDVFPIVNNDITKQISLYNAFNTVGIFTSTPNFIYVTTGSSASANGINLLNAYTTATTLTPNTSALNSTNRTTLVLFPGNYNLGSSSLNLNTQYVDIIGLTRDASHVTITSSNSTATISQTANDVRCIGFTVAGSGPGWSPNNNLSSTYWENVTFNSISANNLSGYFKNCKSTNTISGQGGFVRQSGTASGTFIDCTGINTSFGAAGGGFVGQSSVISGIFINCTGTNAANSGGGFIGQNSTASGTFTNCTGKNTGSVGGGFVGYGSGSKASGIFINCTGTDTTAAGGSFTAPAAKITGKLYNCISNGSFARDSVVSGIFYNCIGDSYTTGSGNQLSGQLYGCIAKTDISGSIAITGQLINCISAESTLPTLTSSGLSATPACYVNCLDGSGRLINGSEKYGIY
jgi:hypothetical protein